MTKSTQKIKLGKDAFLYSDHFVAYLAQEGHDVSMIDGYVSYVDGEPHDTTFSESKGEGILYKLMDEWLNVRSLHTLILPLGGYGLDDEENEFVISGTGLGSNEGFIQYLKGLGYNVETCDGFKCFFNGVNIGNQFGALMEYVKPDDMISGMHDDYIKAVET